MKDDIRRSLIWFIDVTFQGAYVIHGQAGTHQYIGYPKSVAIRMYKELCGQIPVFENQRSI